MTAEEYRALLDTDFSDVKINEMPDMASYHADLNDTIEKRQQKFIRKVGNPYMMRVGKMKVKVSFANNGVSIEEAFKNSEHLINESEYLTLKQQYLLKSEALKKEIDNLLMFCKAHKDTEWGEH